MIYEKRRKPKWTRLIASFDYHSLAAIEVQEISEASVALLARYTKKE